MTMQLEELAAALSERRDELDAQVAALTVERERVTNALGALVPEIAALWDLEGQVAAHEEATAASEAPSGPSAATEDDEAEKPPTPATTGRTRPRRRTAAKREPATVLTRRSTSGSSRTHAQKIMKALQKDNLTVAELHERTGVRKTSIHHALKRLEGGGYIYDTRKKRGRAMVWAAYA